MTSPPVRIAISLEHLLAAVAEAGRLNCNAGKGSAQLVEYESGKSLALDILCDDEQLLARLNDLLEQRQDLLNVGYLLIGDKNERDRR